MRNITDGYTIQIYLGDKREEAENTVEKLFEYDSIKATTNNQTTE